MSKPVYIPQIMLEDSQGEKSYESDESSEIDREHRRTILWAPRIPSLHLDSIELDSFGDQEEMGFNLAIAEDSTEIESCYLDKELLSETLNESILEKSILDLDLNIEEDIIDGPSKIYS